MPASALIYHDTRRVKAGGLYPVKLRVYYNGEKKRYSTGIDISKSDFERSYLATNARGKKHIDLQNKMRSLEIKARQIIDKLEPFNWDRFEGLMFRATSSIKNVYHYYDSIIESLRQQERISTSNNYRLSKKSIIAFVNRDLPKTAVINEDKQYLAFDNINAEFLNKYERWMLKEGKEITTVGIYLRPLRAIFNAAIEAEEIGKEIYPFRKGRYVIPAGNNIKKALSVANLQKLYKYKTEDDHIIKARSFWFFSYLSNGINMKDICELRYKNITSDSIHFIRAKTRLTKKSNQETIAADLSPLAKEVIKRYGNQKVTGETFVFPVYDNLMTAEERYHATRTFTRYINQHMARLAKLARVDQTVSTYAARHTFSTLSVRNGATVEFIQKALGHGSIKTTQNYLASLDTESIKKNSDQLLKMLTK